MIIKLFQNYAYVIPPRGIFHRYNFAIKEWRGKCFLLVLAIVNQSHPFSSRLCDRESYPSGQLNFHQQIIS